MKQTLRIITRNIYFLGLLFFCHHSRATENYLKTETTTRKPAAVEFPKIEGTKVVMTNRNYTVAVFCKPFQKANRSITTFEASCVDKDFSVLHLDANGSSKHLGKVAGKNSGMHYKQLISGRQEDDACIKQSSSTAEVTFVSNYEKNCIDEVAEVDSVNQLIQVKLQQYLETVDKTVKENFTQILRDPDFQKKLAEEAKKAVKAEVMYGTK